MTGSAPALRDVVIVGSGHNALVAACYLAQAGLDVEVVEGHSVPGGAVSTVERFPGYQVDRGSSLHIMIRGTGILDELDLAGVGLRYLDADPWAFHPIPGAPGGGIAFWRDLEKTVASIAAACGPADAHRYRAFMKDWGARNERIFRALCDPPTPGRLARSLWGVGRGTGLPGVELTRQFLSSADDLLDETFDNEHLKTALSWLAAQSGPPGHGTGTANLVGWYALLHRIPAGRPVGGSGGLTRALVARLSSYGGSVRLNDPVSRIEVAAGRASAVVTASGDRIGARAVLSGCHVLTTLDLLGAAAPDGLVERARRSVRVGNGLGMIVRLGARNLPVIPDAPADLRVGMLLGAPDRDTLRTAHGDYISRRTPTRPPVVVMPHSALDPGLAPADRHSVSIWGQWYPYRLAAEKWPDIAEREADRLIAATETIAPGFAAGIEHRYIQTPLDLEVEMGLLRGNVMHVEMSLDAMFTFRPIPELSGYRGPVDGLFLCGASTHPGGGVFGASGRNAALLLLDDLNRASRRPGMLAAPWRRRNRRLGSGGGQ
jgi:phytoene dehydrogenase-like protein